MLFSQMFFVSDETIFNVKKKKIVKQLFLDKNISRKKFCKKLYNYNSAY